MPLKGSFRLLPSGLGGLEGNTVCRSCLRNVRGRRASTAAAVVETAPSMPEATEPKVAYQIKAGLVLSRPPMITRDLHPFEKAFYLYQKRLNERLALPFTRFFYFKEKTPAILEFRRKIKERKTPARDIGRYDAYGPEGWNDEVLIGAPEGEPDHQMEALLKDEEVPKDFEGEIENATSQAEETGTQRPASRTTQADLDGDEKSLNRRLQRTLYLVVQGNDGRWTFPSSNLAEKESLREAAERILTQTGGDTMNTWFVGNLPVGHAVAEYPEQSPLRKENSAGALTKGEKTFFLRARIMTGQANLGGNEFGLKDFKWLSKDEVQRLVTPWYWSRVRNMLMER